MTRTAALVLLAAAVAPAAPVPKEKAIKFGDFGTLVETRGVTCEMPIAGVLSVNVSKEAASESKAHETARPNVARTVEGDFELTVRILHNVPGGKDHAAAFEEEPTMAAGIAMHRADGKRGSLVVVNQVTKCERACHNYFKWEAVYEAKGARRTPGDVGSHVQFMGTPVYLRLIRKGDEFTAARSTDGKEWKAAFEEESFEVPGLGAVQVGPVVAHNTNAQYEVTFDEYTLTIPGEKKK